MKNIISLLTAHCLISFIFTFSYNITFFFIAGRTEEGGSGSDDEGSMFNDNASMTSEASSFAPEIEESANNGVDESSKVSEELLM